MKREYIDKDALVAKYPEQKPICLNYATVREDLIALIEENEALRYILSQRCVSK
jgi:hypothetical protein